MKFDTSELQNLINLVVNTTIKALEERHMISNPNKKTAYQKTEQLLYNYMGFKRIVEDRKLEIEELRKYGVPERDTSIVEFTPKSGSVHGIVLPDESVEAAVQTVQASVERTVQVISLIDKCMRTLRKDPYYKILKMRYFEGRTQEDIALEFDCTQKTISINKSRLVKELSMQLFPDQVIDEIME